MSKAISIFLLSLCLSVRAVAQHSANEDSLSKYGIKPSYKWIKCNPVQQKNFYLLSILEYDKYCRTAIEKDAELSKLHTHYKTLAAKPDLNCGHIPACYTADLLLDSTSVAIAAARLISLYETDPAFRNRLHTHLRESGAFMKWFAESDTAMLAKALKEEANGINLVITRYTTNRDFRYPDIDSASFDVNSPAFKKIIAHAFQYYHQHPDTPLFFYPSLKLALNLLLANNRDEAARHEPLSSTNKVAYSRIRSTAWNNYPYSAILILGEGPDDKKTMSKGGMHRCDLGAALFRKGKAPFIVVSGGYVHPFQTQHCEAIEMKKYLVNYCKIPANAIIVEPHARHTTTNIRNTCRIIYRNGIPVNKKVLCTSSALHIRVILSHYFLNRNISELGYVPYSEAKDAGETTLEFSPVVMSLYWDASDPLDP